MTVDAKPVKRHKATKQEWEQIRAKFEHTCCVACGLPYQTLHHVVPRSQRGDDVIENMVPLCGDGTSGCHGKLEAHAPGWEQVSYHVRSYVMARDSRLRYVRDRIGLARFEKRYPVPPWLSLGGLTSYSQPTVTLRDDSSTEEAA